MYRSTILALLAGALAAGPAAAQPNAPPLPHPVLLTAFPCGVQAGRSVDVVLNGADLDGAAGLLFSTPGLTAELLPSPPLPPPNVRQPNAPRPVPPILCRIRAAADTPLGIHDVRVVTPLGVSNPRAFVVGDRPELVEREPNNDVPEAQRVALESVVHGVISAPADVDYLVFAGKKGQRVLAHCQTSSVDSRLEAALELYDAAGRRLAFNRRYFENDALLDATLPTDGDYHLRVFGFAYTRGDSQHFYRLTLTTRPWVDAAFPPMIEPGKPTVVTFFGRNFPKSQRERDSATVRDGPPFDEMTARLTIGNDAIGLQRLQTTGLGPPRVAGIDGFDYRLLTLAGFTNPALFTYATEPIVLEKEDNDSPETAQALTLPCEVAGRIDRRGDRDWYRLDLKKGESVVLDLMGDRLGAPCDFYLSLRDPAGKELRELDDPPPADILHPSLFYNRTADPPPFRFVAPADGAYRLLVGARDATTVFGPTCVYRLRLGPERPDFRVVVMPSLDNAPQTQVGPQPDALTVPRGGRQYLDVFVMRRDGCAAPITLTAEGLPPGVSCPPQVVPPNAKQAALVFSASPNVSPWTGPVTVIAEGVVGGKTLRREARPATVTWPLNQRNAPTIARLDRQLMLAVRDAGAFHLTADAERLVLQHGDTAKIPLRLVRDRPDIQAGVSVHLLNVPANLIALNNIQAPASEQGWEVTLTARPNVPPGLYQVVLVGKSQPFPTGRPAAPGRPPNAHARYPANPIALTVLPAQVAMVSVAVRQPLKAGGQVEAVVRVVRQFGYAGEFRLKFVPPPDISAPDVVLSAGQSETRIVLTAAADAMPGTRANLVLQAIAPLEGGRSAVQEAKFSVTVVR